MRVHLKAQLQIARFVNNCTFCVVLIAMTGCGFFKPEYIPYEDGSESTESDNCALGLAAFSENVAGSVDSTCATASCHANVASLKLTPSDDSANRKAMLACSRCTDPDTMFAYYNSDAHSGSAQGDALPLASLKAWRDVETASCQ